MLTTKLSSRRSAVDTASLVTVLKPPARLRNVTKGERPSLLHPLVQVLQIEDLPTLYKQGLMHELYCFSFLVEKVHYLFAFSVDLTNDHFYLSLFVLYGN